MIIAIASEDGMNVAERPGRCRGFVVFEVGPSTAMRVGYRCACAQNEGEDYGPRDRPASCRDEPYQSLVAALSDCGALISRSMDERLIRQLQGSAIEAYVCREGNVDQAAQLFANGRLRKLGGASRATSGRAVNRTMGTHSDHAC